MTRSRIVAGAVVLSGVALSGVALSGILLTAPLQAQQPAREKIDLSKLGPQVGQKVPDFSLRDQFGVTRNLNSVMGPRGAMLVFIRSADW